MAQNILLSYAAGGRVMELKTVQVNDHLSISRPCIDIANIGFNVEWSQELSLEQSLHEYIAGMMLVDIFRHRVAGLGGASGDVVYDISLGYDLAGIRSSKIQWFLDQIREPGTIVDEFRAKIPKRCDLPFDSPVSNSVTLSTFHGCPANEIEKICEFLLSERDVNVIVKMNPPMLGRDRLEHLLHEVLRYNELVVNPAAYESGLRFDEAVDLVSRLTALAHQRGLHFGCKFSNTLEVLNHKKVFSAENKVQYLSGQPLHVITLDLTAKFREAVGPAVPISFSAGIDKHNFASTVACGFVPVSVCTDLLRPGGYGRLPAYLHNLADKMRQLGAHDLENYILDTFGNRAAAERMAAEKGGTAGGWASLLNTRTVAQRAQDDPRYRADHNRKAPPRTNSTLQLFNCLTCDKCIPVCPNAANFVYPTPKVAFDYHDILVSPSGHWREGELHRFEITEDLQVANFADFCNECGNCDTFCPEYGGPYIRKPSFYSSEVSWRNASPRDGFFIRRGNTEETIIGRMSGREYQLARDSNRGISVYCDEFVSVTLSDASHHVRAVELQRPLHGEHCIDMSQYFTLRYLLSGVQDQNFVNPLNVRNSC
jgi:putative selenate reductase